jgi:predicted AAA+ superfamily ATPase
MERAQKSCILRDLEEKYVFLAGPRQSGKTTLAKALLSDPSTQYLNYDLAEDRLIMTNGQWNRNAALVILDEFHKFPKWKTFLKGYYDTENNTPPILVTGSAKLNVFRKGNDSMVGRYYYHRLLPLSIRELKNEYSSQVALGLLLKYGNFPEPFLKKSATESKRWKNYYINRVIREDVTDLSNVQNISKIQLLVDLLRQRVGSPVSYASLAEDLEVAPKTVKQWINLLEQLFVVFRVTPYHKNIARSLLKEPKVYFYDATMASDPNAHLENLVAVSLLKHLYYLEDNEGIRPQLHYLRTKDRLELDFLTVEDGIPTSIIEVKTSDSVPAKAFYYFNKFLSQVPKFQIVKNIRQPKTVNKIQVERADLFLLKLAV